MYITHVWGPSTEDYYHKIGIALRQSLLPLMAMSAGTAVDHGGGGSSGLFSAAAAAAAAAVAYK